MGLIYGGVGVQLGIAGNGNSGELSFTANVNQTWGLIAPDAYVYTGGVYNTPTNSSLNSDNDKGGAVGLTRGGIAVTKNSVQLTFGPSMSAYTAVYQDRSITRTTRSIPYLGYLVNPTRAVCKLVTGH